MKDLGKKDFKKESSSSPKGEDQAVSKKPSKLNDPHLPMRRKNKILGDGRDWFDTHPDA
jgi:hypothetical protein|tara:strand:- start:481 stop:657 length:177 start_codon:yes stop_codon:yes gene_type:complete